MEQKFRGMDPDSANLINAVTGSRLKLVKEIRRLGGEVKESAKDVYQVTGVVHMPVQVVVTGDLEGDEFAGLRILSKKPREADIRLFVDKAGKFSEPGDKQDADSVLQVSFSANRKIYDDIRRRDAEMYEWARELFKPEYEAMEAEIERQKEENKLQKEENKRLNILVEELLAKLAQAEANR